MITLLESLFYLLHFDTHGGRHETIVKLIGLALILAWISTPGDSPKPTWVYLGYPLDQEERNPRSHGSFRILFLTGFRRLFGMKQALNHHRDGRISVLRHFVCSSLELRPRSDTVPESVPSLPELLQARGSRWNYLTCALLSPSKAISTAPTAQQRLAATIGAGGICPHTEQRGAVVERSLPPEQIDTWFETSRDPQCTLELLLSSASSQGRGDREGFQRESPFGVPRPIYELSPPLSCRSGAAVERYSFLYSLYIAAILYFDFANSVSSELVLKILFLSKVLTAIVNLSRSG